MQKENLDTLQGIVAAEAEGVKRIATMLYSMAKEKNTLIDKLQLLEEAQKEACEEIEELKAAAESAGD